MHSLVTGTRAGWIVDQLSDLPGKILRILCVLIRDQQRGHIDRLRHLRILRTAREAYPVPCVSSAVE